MMLTQVWIVLVKEIIDNLRDRRSMFLALIYPFIGALLLGLLMTLVGGMMKGQSKRTLSISVVGAERAPDLARYLKSRNIKIRPGPENPRQTVRDGKAGAVVVITPDYAKNFAAGKTGRIDVLINATRLSTVVTVSRIAKILRTYSKRVSQSRLKNVGVEPHFANPIRVKSVNVGRSRNLAGFFLNMLPPFLIFTVFVGGVYLAIDSIAGERERGSLEPLLANPVSRSQLMLGKAISTFFFTLTTVVVQLLAFKGMFELIAVKQTGLAVNPGFFGFFVTFLICMPLVLFAVGIQFIVATVSRSYKETQTYLALLPLIPSLPGMILVFVPLNAQTWMMGIPTFGQILLIGQLMREEPIAALDVVVCVTFTLAAAAAMLGFAARLYKRDVLLFGG